MPPEASVVTEAPVASFQSATSATAFFISATVMLSRRIRSAPASSAWWTSSRVRASASRRQRFRERFIARKSVARRVASQRLPQPSAWLSFTRNASERPIRWFVPPPQRTAYFSKSAQAGRRLARVEEVRGRPRERVDVGPRRRRDAGQPLDEVQRGPLGREDRDGRPLDPGEDGSRADAGAVLDEDLDGGRGAEEGEDAREERGAGDDGRLAADHVARDAGLGTEDGEGGDVLSVFREGARQEVVQGFDEASIDLHEKSILDGRPAARAAPLR